MDECVEYVNKGRYGAADAPDFEVIAWPGDYGLASMDVDCNRLILYMRFTRASFHVAHPRNPAWQTHQLPTLRLGARSTHGFEKCVEELRFHRFSLDFGQSCRRCSEMHAFSVMVQEKLAPILEYVFWVDAANYGALTRLWYSRQTPPLLSVWYIQQRKQRAWDVIQALENLDFSQEGIMKEYFMKHAKECFQTLSTRLGTGDFFFAQCPTSLDCVVYAFLAPLMKIPFPSDGIPKILKGFNNLVAYVQRIDKLYQPDMIDVSPRFLPSKDEDGDAVESSLRLKLFSSVFVACAMIGYAVANKIVKLPK